MQISLYIGKRKKKDRLVNNELEKFVEGDRSDRIKDLILKGLLFEGRGGIDERLLDIKYLPEDKIREILGKKSNGNRANELVTIQESKPKEIEKNIDIKPDLSELKLKKSKEYELDLDKEIENRI